MKRACTTCACRGFRREAEFVAAALGGWLGELVWFECPDHSPTDNAAEVLRVRRQPIGEWFESIGIPFESLAELEEPPPATERGRHD